MRRLQGYRNGGNGETKNQKCRDNRCRKLSAWYCGGTFYFFRSSVVVWRHFRNCTCYVADGRTVVNCGVGTNVENVAVDHFVTVLEDVENVAVDHFVTILEECEEYWLRITVSRRKTELDTSWKRSALIKFIRGIPGAFCWTLSILLIFRTPYQGAGV